MPETSIISRSHPVSDVKNPVVVRVEIIWRRQPPDIAASVPQQERFKSRVILHSEVAEVRRGSTVHNCRNYSDLSVLIGVFQGDPNPRSQTNPRSSREGRCY